MTTLLGQRSLVQEAAALRAGTDDPVDAVNRTCDRIDAVDPQVRAFVPEAGRRTRLLEAARRSAAGIDLWIAPSATGPAPVGLDSTGTSIMCLPWSNAGLPAVSVPAGQAANGLPLGLQLVGRFGADEDLLYGAAGIERVVNRAGSRRADGRTRPGRRG
ncbi:amidase family protein [Streptomyces decoyicus]|uniref:amidase family protein n=1 Tax=Streptomyces decoyicus TaxID=249567 RepID=UPI00363B17EF